jgi:hypothetical protein
LPRIYMYSPDTLTASHPSGDPNSDLWMGWPVAWWLGAHSTKHRWSSMRLPSLNPIMGSLRQFGHRLRWAWHFRHRTSSSSSHCSFKLAKKQISPYTGVADPAVEAFISDVTSAVFGICNRAHAAMSFVRPSHRPWGNRPALANFAYGIVDRAGWDGRTNDIAA